MAAPPRFRLPASGIAISGTASIAAPSQTRLSDQPSRPISPWLIGAKTNMPAEPAAVPRPKANERRSALT